MKKLIYILALSSLAFLSACSNREKLLFLNWGEYISEEAIELFEAEYNIDVIMDIADSNEMFYSKVKSGTTAYDLVMPSEYMVDKMVANDLLQKIDKSLLSNYDEVNNPFLPGVIGIQESMFEGYTDYTVPYLWGTFGLMYNKKIAGLEEAVITNGWNAFFKNDIRPAGTRVGMYDVPRFAYAAASMYQGLGPNATTKESLNMARSALLGVNFSQWGTDTLKKGIASNNLDLAFVYTGDHLDMLYTKLETTALEDISFDIYVPDDTIAFMDTFVIPKKARHLDAAHKFIDFFLRKEIALMNASVIGYCTPLFASYLEIVNYEGDDEWLTNWAYANKTYYPLPKSGEKQFKGTPLISLDKKFLNEINIMINNVKAGS